MVERFIDPGGQEVGPQDLTLTQARALADLLASGRLSFSRLLGCRRGPDASAGGEAVMFEAIVERPQVLIHPIRESERLAAIFHPHEGMQPEVLALRCDFPLVPHLNLRTYEIPRNLCLDARPWSEVSRRWTPAIFLERVRWWLAQTARGSLHQDDQPLEPLILDTAIPIILPANIIASSMQKQEFLTVRTGSSLHGIIALHAESSEEAASTGTAPEYIAIGLRCLPQPHGVIRQHPDTIDELHALALAAGLDLKRELEKRFRDWIHRDRVKKSRLIILLSLPKQREPGGPIEETDVFAVACFDTIAEVGLKLGIWKHPKQNYEPKSRRNRSAGKLPREGEPVKIYLLRPVFGLTPAKAARLCGDPPRPVLKWVAIGAGALGSQVLMNLARAGYTTWTIIDDDRVLPHNLQRHALGGYSLGFGKARVVAVEMNALFDGSDIATEIGANLLYPGSEEKSVDAALAEADTILDLSASIGVARYLSSRMDIRARRASLFLNPAGTDLVLLAEDADRAVSLDSIEMQYYRLILRESQLGEHLRSSDERVRYSASCRDVSARLATHLVTMLAAIGAGAIPSTLDGRDASISIWQTDPATLSVSRIAAVPKNTLRGRIGEWTLILDEELLSKLGIIREAKLPNETGGVLLGAYDMDRRTIYGVDTIPSPRDSEEWPGLYIRGCEGLTKQINDARSLTADQVEYIGEWHSHPNGHPTRPSGDDKTVFGWLTDRMAPDGLPPLLAIVGENGVSSWYVAEMRMDTVWDVELSE